MISRTHPPVAVRARRATLLGLLLAIGLPGVGASSLHAQTADPWKADWNVRCTWFYRTLLYMTTELATKLFEEMVPEDAPDWIVDALCSDSDTELEAGFSRIQFRAGSHWLQQLGFPAPTVRPAPDDRKYLAWLDEHIFRDTTAAPGEGVIEANGRYYGTGDLFISPPMVRVYAAVEPHELFHGVQKSAASGPWYKFLGDIWVWEGTARAVDMAWGDKPNTWAHAARWDAHHFDRPLDWIPGWDNKGPAYGTSIFWLDVGRQLRATDWVGYLPEVLARMEDGSPSREAVDAALIDAFTARGTETVGLYHAYPEFVRYRLSDPALAGDQFEDPSHEELSLHGVDQVDRQVPRKVVEALAANALTVRVQVPAGVVAGLRIEFVQDDPALHLIVDRRRVNRAPTPTRPGRTRNVFSTWLQPTDTTFYVRVANVAPDAPRTQPLGYTLKLSLKTLKRCDSDQMMAALHPRARELMPALQPADRYEATYETEPGLHPAPGWLWITGLVSDRGDACTEPLGSNPALGFQMGDKDAGERFRAAAERVMNLSPEELRKAMDAAAPDALATLMQQLLPGFGGGAARQSASMLMEAMGEDSDAVFSISSPDGMAWQLGTPTHMFLNQRFLRHSGVGGWAPNAGAAVTLRLRGVSPSRLREDSTYDAELVTVMTRIGTPVYSRWSGREFTVRCQGMEFPLFEGTTEWVTAQALTGNVTITRITGAAVEGRFELRGTGRYEKEEFRRVESGGCVTTQSSGPQVRTGEVGIAGTFSAPAIAETQRFGRGVALTDAAAREAEDDGDIVPLPAVYPPGLDDEVPDEFWCGRSPFHMALCACIVYTAAHFAAEPSAKALTACVCSLPGGRTLKACIPDPGSIEFPDPAPDRPTPCSNPADCVDPEPEPKPCTNPDGCTERKEQTEERCTDPGGCEDEKKKQEENCTLRGDCPKQEPDSLKSGVGVQPPSNPPTERPREAEPPAPPGADPSAEAFALRGALWLAFEQTAETDVTSSWQLVEGAAASEPGAIHITGRTHSLRLSLTPQEIAACRIPGMLGGMLAGGQSLTAAVDLKVNAAADHVELTVTDPAGQGSFRFEAGGPAAGRVQVGADPAGGVRIAIQDGRFELSGQGGNVSCDGVGDFSGRITRSR